MGSAENHSENDECANPPETTEEMDRELTETPSVHSVCPYRHFATP